MRRLRPPGHRAVYMRQVQIIAPEIYPLPPTLDNIRDILSKQVSNHRTPPSNTPTAQLPQTRKPRRVRTRQTRITLQLRIPERQQPKRRHHGRNSIFLLAGYATSRLGLLGVGEGAVEQGRVEVEEEGDD